MRGIYRGGRLSLEVADAWDVRESDTVREVAALGSALSDAVSRDIGDISARIVRATLDGASVNHTAVSSILA